MGAGYSSEGRAMTEDNDDPLIDIGGDDPLIDIGGDDPLIDISEDPIGGLSETKIKKMKKRACAVDPKLNANPRRKAPPIDPKTCIEGSVANGKDGEPYVIHKGRWIKATKRLAQRQKELIRERLDEKLDIAKIPMKKAVSPKRGPGRPRGSKKAVSPKREPGRPRGSKKAVSKKAVSPKRGPGRPRGSKKTVSKTPMRKKRCANGSRKSKKSGKCVKK